MELRFKVRHQSPCRHELVKNRTRTNCPRVDSISCPAGQNFLGKCVPRTHHPGGHNFLRQRR